MAIELLKRVFTGEIKAIDEKERTLTAYVSTAARDRMDEVLDPGGVDLKAYKQNPVVLFAHDYSSPPIAKALWIKRDGEGILSKMQFANTEFAQEVFSLYKDGYMKAFSVGFIPKEWEDGDGEKKARRTYKKWEMLEYSAVPVPANPEALALAMQKGILKDEHLKEMLTSKEKIKEGEDDIAEPPAPVIAETTPEKAISELLTTIETQNTKILELENTIRLLKFDLLESQKPKEKTLSGMTDGDILKKVEEITIGVIRKITGKVN